MKTKKVNFHEVWQTVPLSYYRRGRTQGIQVEEYINNQTNIIYTISVGYGEQ